MDMSFSPAGPGRVHVLQVLGQALVGGMESCLLQLVERLPCERFATTVICPQEGELAERLAGRRVLTTLHARQFSVLDLALHRSAGTHLHVVCRQSYFHALG
jgi:hypothetical protein